MATPARRGFTATAGAITRPASKPGRKRSPGSALFRRRILAGPRLQFAFAQVVAQRRRQSFPARIVVAGLGGPWRFRWRIGHGPEKVPATASPRQGWRERRFGRQYQAPAERPTQFGAATLRFSRNQNTDQKTGPRALAWRATAAGREAADGHNGKSSAACSAENVRCHRRRRDRLLRQTERRCRKKKQRGSVARNGGGKRR